MTGEWVKPSQGYGHLVIEHLDWSLSAPFAYRVACGRRVGILAKHLPIRADGKPDDILDGPLCQGCLSVFEEVAP